MRLNWNNLGKGLEGIAAAKQASDLARESAKYDVTEGAYGPGLQENITQLEGLKAQDPAQAAAYDQAIAELQRRQGLTAADYSVASGPTNYATRQEARQAAAPMRAEGLAGVYRRYGDVAKADELEARAYEQQRALAAEERAKAAENRAAQDFATRQTKTGLEINRLTREEAEQQNATNFAAFAAENPNATVQELKDAAFKQFKFTPKQWQDAVNTRLGISDTEQKIFVSGIKDKLKGKNLQQLGALYNSDPDFDDKTDLAIVPGKNGAVTLNFIDKATKKITSTQSFSSEALATEYLNKQATQPEIIGSWMLNLRKVEADIDQSKASAERSRSLARREDAARGLTQAQEDYQKKLDGVFEGYQSAMALGPQGRQAAAIYAREYDQLRASVPKGLRAPPSIASMNDAQRAEKPEKPVKVEEAGVQYKVGGKVVQTDGMGGFMSPKGVLPDDRPKALRAAGVSDNNASRVMWSNDGETVMFNGEEYDVRNKRDMAKLNKDMEEYDVLNGRIAQENKLRGNPTAPSGFQGARTTGLGPASSYGAPVGAPSIYGR